MNKILVEVSVGDLLDKISILEIFYSSESSDLLRYLEENILP